MCYAKTVWHTVNLHFRKPIIVCILKTVFWLSLASFVSSSMSVCKSSASDLKTSSPGFRYIFPMWLSCSQLFHEPRLYMPCTARCLETKWSPLVTQKYFLIHFISQLLNYFWAFTICLRVMALGKLRWTKQSPSFCGAQEGVNNNHVNKPMNKVIGMLWRIQEAS